MIIESELQIEIARVVAGNASLVDLYRWLMARNWNVLRNSDAGAIDLAGEVEDILHEWSDGLQSASQAIHSLAALIPARHDVWISANVPVVVSLRFDAEPQPCIVKSTSTQVFHWLNPALAEL